MTTFWVLQALDIYSTYKGMKYDCLKESNPLLPAVPELEELVLHKAVTLWPFVLWQKYDLLTDRDIELPIAMYVFVVAQNLELYEEAKQKCNLR